MKFACHRNRPHELQVNGVLRVLERFCGGRGRSRLTKDDRMRDTHADGCIVFVCQTRVRNTHPEVLPEPRGDAYVKQCSAANRVCTRHCTSLAVDVKC